MSLAYKIALLAKQLCCYRANPLQFFDESAGATLVKKGGLGTTPQLVLTDTSTYLGDPTGSATGFHSTVGGGEGNIASDANATIGGGGGNTASQGNTTIGGGEGNTASGDNATIGGGQSNTASGENSTVAGGASNQATGGSSSVGGGDSNVASGDGATIAGGSEHGASGNYSTVGGGANNYATGFYSTVGGGSSNSATGVGSLVPGGWNNTASGDGSVAIGAGTTARHFGELAQSNGTVAQRGQLVMHAQTTDATPVQVTLNGTLFIVPANNEVWRFRAGIAAKCVAASKAWAYDLEFAVTNFGGTLVQLGTTDVGFNKITGSTIWTAAVYVSGDDVSITVTGAGGETVEWAVDFWYVKVG